MVERSLAMALSSTGTVAVFGPLDRLLDGGRSGPGVPSNAAAAIWSADGSVAVIGPGEPVDRGMARDALVFLAAPFPLRFRIPALRAGDRFEVEADVEFDATLIRERAELSAFRQFCMASGSVTASALAVRFEEHVAAVLREYVAARPVESVVGSADDAELDRALAARLQPELFAIGLALGRGVRTAFRSAAWEALRRDEQSAALRERQASAQARIREALAAARESHLAHLESLLKRMQTLSQEQGGVRLAELIRAFDLADRGALYEGLLRLAPAETVTQFIAAVAGHELLFIDPARPESIAKRVSFGPEAGPLRSIRCDADGTLLLGAANGVHRLRLAGGPRQLYIFKPPSPLRGGVNAAVERGSRLYATHSEVGLIDWPLDRPNAPEFPLSDLTQRVTTVRDVQLDGDGRLWLAVGPSVVSWAPDSPLGAVQLLTGETVESLLVTADDVLAGLSNGSILRFLRADPSVREVVRPATRDGVHALAAVSTGGVPRVLVVDGRPMAELLVLSDAYQVAFTAPEPLRWGWSADDCVVAANERRDRLYVWQTRDPARSPAVCPIGRLSGHSVQDVLLIPRGRIVEPEAI